MSQRYKSPASQQLHFKQTQEQQQVRQHLAMVVPWLVSMHEQLLHVKQPLCNVLQQQQYHIRSTLHASLHSATVLCFAARSVASVCGRCCVKLCRTLLVPKELFLLQATFASSYFRVNCWPHVITLHVRTLDQAGSCGHALPADGTSGCRMPVPLSGCAECHCITRHHVKAASKAAVTHKHLFSAATTQGLRCALLTHVGPGAPPCAAACSLRIMADPWCLPHAQAQQHKVSSAEGSCFVAWWFGCCLAARL